MNDILTLDEQTQDLPVPTADMKEVVAKAKHAFRTVVEHASEHGHAERNAVEYPLHAERVRERAELEAWFTSLSEPQRDAYEAYQDRGLTIDEDDKRTLLRGALALHPNRDVAAETIGGLRVTPDRNDDRQGPEQTEGLDALSQERSEEPRQDLTSLVPAEAEVAHERSNQEAFERAVSRVEDLVKEASEARTRNTTKYKALGLPELPKDSPRRKLLEQAVAPELSADSSKSTPIPFAQLDQRLHTIHKDIIDDPLWIAADYLDRTTSLEKVEDHVRGDAGVQKAKDSYRGAEDQVRQASRALDAYTPRGRWQRVVDVARGNGKTEQDRLLTLHGTMKEASLALHSAKREVDRAEREARDVALVRNAQALEIQRDAQATRDALERPLREALIERHIAGHALRDDRLPLRLRDAQDHGSLAYDGERSIGGFAFHEFSAFGGTTFLADAVETRGVLEKLNLARGERVILRSDERGARHLQLEDRCHAVREIAGAQRAKAAGRSMPDPHERAR